VNLINKPEEKNLGKEVKKMKKMKRRFLALGVVAAMVAALVAPSVALAVDPTVAITVSAKTIAITNSQATWGIGTIVVDAVVYFSTDGTQNDTWSQIANTGNVAVDVEIQGTNFEGGLYDWVLAATTGSEQYTLFANSEGAPTTYNVEVKSSVYGDLTTGLAKAGTYNWSMKFTAPSGFNASDDGSEKSATVTLVASQAA